MNFDKFLVIRAVGPNLEQLECATVELPGYPRIIDVDGRVFDTRPGEDGGVDYVVDFSSIFASIVDGINGTDGSDGTDGIQVSGSGTEDDPFVFRLVLCEFISLDQADVDAANDVSIIACVDGANRRIPLGSAGPSIQGTDGANGANGANGIDVGGDGTEGNPFTFTLNVCSVNRVFTPDEIAAANSITLAACLDGQTGLVPYAPESTVPAGERCQPVNLQDNNAGAAGSTFMRSNFTFVEQAPLLLASGGPLPVTIRMVGTGVSLNPVSANRFQMSANSAAGTVSRVIFTFDKVIDTIEFSFRDVDVPFENITSWSKTPDSIAPPFANGELDSRVIITGINSNVVSFDHFGTTGPEIVGHIQRVTTLGEPGPCFAAQRCVGPDGFVFRDLQGNLLTGSYSEC